MKGQDTDQGDLLYGIKSIAQHLRLTPRQVGHLIENGSIPTFKLGFIVCATRSGLRSYFDGLLAANVSIRARTGDPGAD